MHFKPNEHEHSKSMQQTLMNWKCREFEFLHTLNELQYTLW